MNIEQMRQRRIELERRLDTMIDMISRGQAGITRQSVLREIDSMIDESVQLKRKIRELENEKLR